jgi:hypothetical protein
MLQVGIVGLPNVGKSTLFRVLTEKQVDCENFPFCTIEPNVGVVEVPDDRLEKLAKISESEEVIPTAIEFVDIAGLVKGAHKGEGLGNQFLANIREVDMIAHVVRNFENTNITHVDGSIDPERDREVIEIELAMADMSSVEKRLEKVQNEMKAGETDELKKREALLERILETLEDGGLAQDVEMDDEDRLFLKELQLLTMKPILYVVNVNEEDAASDSWENPLDTDRPTLPICVETEDQIVAMDKSERKEFLEALGLGQSGTDRLIKKAYNLLNLITFFTSGEKETRAWTTEKGSTAPQAAGKIHTDFEKGFIRAEVVGVDTFIKLGGWSAAGDQGELRLEGKDYIVKDGDVCHFRFNV